MSNLENRILQTHKLPKSTQSFEEIFDEIVNDDVSEDVASINSELFEISPNYNDNPDNKYPVEKLAHNLITITSQSRDILDSSLRDYVQPNETQHCKRSSKYREYQIDSGNKYLDRYVSTQESLCTECGFGNTLNSFFGSFNNTPHPTQSSSFLPEMNQIHDPYGEKILSQKQSISSTPKRRNSEINMAQYFPLENSPKKFKSKGSISIVKKVESNSCKIKKPVIIPSEISMQNYSNIANDCCSTLFPGVENNSDNVSEDTPELDKTLSRLSSYSESLADLSTLHQDHSEELICAESVRNNPVENTAHDIEETLIDGNVSTDTNCSDFMSSQTTINEIYYIDVTDEIERSNDVELMKEIQETHSLKCNNSTLSGSTIKEIYCAAASDEVDHLKTVELTKETQETNSFVRDNSTFSQSTIEEIYYTDAAAQNECSTGVKAARKMPQYQIAGENSVHSIINDEIFRDKEIMESTVITGCSLQPLINSVHNEIKMGEKNPENLSCKENSENEYVVNNSQTQDNLESKCLTETDLMSTKTEDRITARHIAPVSPIDGPTADADSAKDTDLINEKSPKGLDESILNISLESEWELIVKQDTIIAKGKINSVNVSDNLKTNFTTSNNISEVKKKTRNQSVDSSTVITNNSPAKDANQSKNIIAKNVETRIEPDDFDTQFMTDTQLKNIEKQLDEIETKDLDTVDMTTEKVPNTLSKDVQSLEDDLSLELLSESQLQRIEDEAYMNAEEQRAINLNNMNTKSIVNEQDVFYRPQVSNRIIEKRNDDLVIPNWMKNPAPEPNYEKMKRAVQMRREHIKKMFEEILRLSAIVSKVRNIVYTEHRNDSELESKGSSQIQDSNPIQRRGTNPKDSSVELEVSDNTEININRRSHVAAADPKGSDIFYVPQSSRLNYNPPSKTVVDSASTAIIDTNILKKDPKESGKFYVPQSKYNAPIFNRPSDVKFNRSNVSSSCMESKAPNMLSSLKQIFEGNKTSEGDVSSIWYSRREIETDIGNRKSDNNVILNSKFKLENRMNADYQLPKINPNVTVPSKDMTVLNTNKLGPVIDHTVFYLPDKLSSASNNYKILPSINNNQTLSSSNFTTHHSTRVKPDEQRPLNSGKNSTPYTISNDNSIFYNSDKKKGYKF